MFVEYLRQSIRIRSNKEITIRIRENYGYPQNIYPRIHIRASLQWWHWLRPVYSLFYIYSSV